LARHLAWALLAAFAVAPALRAVEPAQPPGPPAAPAGQAEKRPEEKQSREGRSQDPPRSKWWLHSESRKELGITDTQSAEIDKIYESTMPAQRAKWRERNRQDELVSKLLKEHVADVATVTQEVDRLEKLEAEVRTTRLVMLYRIHLVLTPEQRTKLEAFVKRREENRRRSDRR
jgi:Spy/CpxP family protein refolding chaperone